MIIQDTGLLIIAALLSAAALIVGFFLGAEVIRVVRDFFSALRGGTGASSDTDPEAIASAQRAAQRNRAAVKRMITRFQEHESSSGPPPKS